MTTMINWQNPYENLHETWFRGSLHNHTTPNSPCGRVLLPRVLELYEKAGFDFLSISDHLCWTDVQEQTTMQMIPGIEWNSWQADEGRHLTHNDHIGIYAMNGRLLEKSRYLNRPEEMLRAFAGEPLLAVLNHPNWEINDHYSVQALLHLAGIGAEAGLTMGVEVHNDLTEFEADSVGDASRKWDRLLTEGRPVIGLASDDSHNERDIGRAWLMVNAAERSARAIFTAICQARFYLTTGVAIKAVGRDGSTLFCEAEEDTAIDLIGKNGTLFQEGCGRMQIDCSRYDSQYFRFALYGRGKRKAWTQPFFV